MGFFFMRERQTERDRERRRAERAKWVFRGKEVEGDIASFLGVQ